VGEAVKKFSFWSAHNLKLFRSWSAHNLRSCTKQDLSLKKDMLERKHDAPDKETAPNGIAVAKAFAQEPSSMDAGLDHGPRQSSPSTPLSRCPTEALQRGVGRHPLRPGHAEPDLTSPLTTPRRTSRPPLPSHRLQHPPRAPPPAMRAPAPALGRHRHYHQPLADPGRICKG
jgi:hypothetical protein